MLHLEKNGPCDLLDSRFSSAHNVFENLPSSNQSVCEATVTAHASNSSAFTRGEPRAVSSETFLPQFCSALAEQMKQQQETMRQLLEALTIGRNIQQTQSHPISAPRNNIQGMSTDPWMVSDERRLLQFLRLKR